MKGLARAVVSFFELVEAEGRELKRSIFKLSVSVTLVAIAGSLVVMGVGFVAAAVFLLIFQLTGFNHPVTAALLTGLFIFALGGGSLWLAMKNLQ